MSKLKQLGLLIWKNFKLQRKRPIGTIFQLGLPFSASCIFLALQVFLVTAKDCPALVWNEFNVTSPPPALRRSFSIGLAANNASQLSHELFNNLTFYLNEHAYLDQNITLQIFPNEDDMEDNFCLGKNGHGWLTKYVFLWFQNPGPRIKDDSHEGSPDYYSSLSSYIQFIIPVVIEIAFFYTALVTVHNIVYEKEQQLKETLKIIGVNNWLHWVAWFIHSFLIYLVAVVIMTLLFTIKLNSNGRVIDKTAPTIFFIYLLLYITSGILFCFFVSVFFSKASSAAKVVGVILSISFLLFFCIMQYYDKIPNLGMTLGAIVVGKFEGSGSGVQWDNLFHGVDVDDTFSLGTVFIMMIISCAIYGMLTWYIENVFPGQYGTSKPFYFPFTKSYWCGSFEKVSNDDETLPLLRNAENFETSKKFERAPQGLDVGIDIKNLVKIYDGVTGKKVAVDDVTLKIFEGQITVVFGHNGAGKSSLMSVLTGFYSPSQGTAVVNGYDIRTSMDGVRSSLGLCPQHDVLFDRLTVKEHLWFFGKLKGLSSDEIDSEVVKMMESIKLADKANAQTRYLSGGMKRKLSLGVALIGKTKVLMLDEPTSGMDPSARRFTWELLEKYRDGRTILLTTHSMDEADFLGDRIAIMAEGKIRCCGSSFVFRCAELSYILPRESSRNFSTLFSELETRRKELGIASYGASMTTMEQVFMKVATECDDTLNDRLQVDAINASVSTVNDEDTLYGRNNSMMPLTNTRKPQLNCGITLFLQRWCAMFKKRFRHSRRPKMAIIRQLVVPLIYTMLALIVIDTILKPEDSPPRILTTALFYDNIALYAIVGNPNREINDLVKMYTHSASSYTKFVDIDKDSALPIARAWFNDQAYHAIAVALSAVDNAILKNTTGNKNKLITVTNHPLPRTTKQKSNDLDDNNVGLIIAAFLLFGMPFLASYFVVFVVQERTNGAKHVQFVSGVDPISYWTASWLWDMVNFTPLCIGIVILFACFNVPAYTEGYRLGIVFLVLMLYGSAIIPFMYLFSFLFKTASKAFNLLTLLNFVTGPVALLVVFYIQSLDYHYTVDVLNWTFLVLPNFCLGQSFSNIFENYNRIRLYNMCMEKHAPVMCMPQKARIQTNYLAFENPGIGRFLLVLPLEGIFFMLIILFIDFNAIRSLRSSIRSVYVDPFDSSHPNGDTEDSDVMAEKRRVLNDEVNEDVVVVKDLTKIFKVPGRRRFAAVDHISLGIPLGECFGLLGVNGAGKTTMFKMLTGDVIPTSGTAVLDSWDIQTNLSRVRQRTGYCPQFDALIDFLTGREMLQMYAALRGVPNHVINPLIEDLMRSVLLTEHADMLTKTYSGGNKRKLSTAIALIGDPLIVFLDEPTTGMDPVARRLLWNTLCRVRAEGRCLMITSHSMEECEALCTRLAIMANGKLRFLGSPQHLKNKFVQGFTLLVNPPSDTPSNDTTLVKEFVAETFPGSVLRNEHSGWLNYHIGDSKSSWSSLFAILEDAHSRSVIGNYSIKQTTLDEIFLNFALSQGGYDD
ncbi:phospholipid-transporting ATPase ABCA3-like [Xenia sp. Carnegie-2017]|uniref:phospholipid-transporting ATPase ABCA3-like n=1 Tax=Xenia sp. Carnegie-2017 TaxID=2897299 RepID=UPI001F04972D|nr:phospholipid-transporting ATPase ABCA3-like [Xenia sp. Carnegie-2017]